MKKSIVSMVLVSSLSVFASDLSFCAGGPDRQGNAQ